MTLLSTQAKQIQRLHREANQSYRQIAASVGCSPATAYRYASDPKRATSERAKPIRASKLQSVDRDAFLQLLLSSRSNSEVVARMLCEFPQEYGLPQGFTVSARTVRRFIRSDFAAYAKRSQPVPIGDAHYEPGAQVQIDFVLTKFQFAGDDFLTKVPLFEAVFPWSHKAYVRVCPDMKQVSWFRSILGCIARCGCPSTILMDNDRGLVTQPKRRDRPAQFNDSLVWLLREVGISPRACRPARPETKGVVERFGRTLKENAIPYIQSRPDLKIATPAELQDALDEWLVRVYQNNKYRRGGTKQVLTVDELYEIEKEYLQFIECGAEGLTVSSCTARADDTASLWLHGQRIRLPRSYAQVEVIVNMTAGGSYQITNSFGKKIVDGVIPKENLSAYKQFEKGSHHSDNADFPEMNGNENLENLDSYLESLR